MNPNLGQISYYCDKIFLKSGSVFWPDIELFSLNISQIWFLNLPHFYIFRSKFVQIGILIFAQFYIILTKFLSNLGHNIGLILYYFGPILLKSGSYFWPNYIIGESRHLKKKLSLEVKL